MAQNGVVSIVLQAKDAASKVIQGVSGQLKKFGAEAKEMLGSKLGQILSLGAIVAGLKDVTNETLKWDQSLRDLSGAAKLTGAPLDFIRSIAARVRTEVSTSRIEANQFAEELVRLAAKAGDLTLVDKNFKAIFDTLAAQGFRGEQALNALQSAVEGNDRVIKKLFNIKPDELYERFAASIGKTADQLTAAEKAQAIFNQFALSGVKTQGELEKQLASTGEKVGDVAEALSDAKIALGEDLRPAIDLVAQGFVFLVKGASLFVKSVGALGSLLGAIFFSVTDAIFGVGSAVLQLVQGDFAGATKTAKETASSIKNNFVGAVDAIKESYASLDDQAVGFDKEALARANAAIRKEREKEAAIEKAKQAQKLLEQELALIDNKIKANKDEKADRDRLSEIETEIKKKLEDQKLSLEEQIRLQGILLQIEQTRQDLTNRNLGENEKGPRGNRVAGGDGGLGNQGQDNGGNLDENGNRKPDGILAGGRPDGIPAAAREKARSLGAELSAVFAEAAASPLQGFFSQLLDGFDNAGEAAKAFGRSVAQSLANIAAQLAANAILKVFLKSAFVGGGGIPGAPTESFVGLADGGLVQGPGGPRDDKILAALSNGEGVLNAKAVAAIGGRAGIDFLNGLGTPGGFKVPRFADGGIAGAATEGGRLDGSITVGLGDGLVLDQLDSPTGSRGLIRVISRNKNAMNAALGR